VPRPAGHEADYSDWFLDAGTHGHGVPPAIRNHFTAAYTGHDALHRHYCVCGT
jgi:hypothetical protein